MKRVKVIIPLLLILLFVLNVPLSFGGAAEDRLLEKMKTTVKPKEPLLTPGIKIEGIYKPGKAAEIGLVEIVQGDGFVVHQGEMIAYKAKKGQSLHMGDTLVTGEKSRIQARLNDQSSISIADHSKLILSRIQFSASEKKRNSAYFLFFGRVRFAMTKLLGTSQIKTPTAVCGVRGSDFALMVAPKDDEYGMLRRIVSELSFVRDAHAQAQIGLLTAVVTGANTTVSFGGVAGAVQTVGAFSVSSAAAGAAAAVPAVVGAAAAGAALEAVGPGLAIAKMPAYMEQ